MRAELRANSLDINGQTYPLQNIARIGITEHTRNWKRHIRPIVVALVLVFVVGALGLMSGANGPALVAAVLVVFFLLRAAYKFVILRGDKAFRYYSLNIETAGAPHGALFSKDVTAIRALRDQLVSHVEEPPDQAISINLDASTFIAGDQVNVEGKKNIGKLVN